ncbi:MAG TPA: zf-HC2 domain-containing protein [Syntrophales bacterium]|nr:zf-HC2 domain-containing protein [Syntrophales bacterium]HRU89137.1 zf-HC2 domain-containing protein [Syntrophales bacterium]
MERKRSEMMGCEDAGLLLSRNLDGDLGKEETVRLYLHLARCDDCRRLLERLAAQEQGIALLRDAFERQAVRGDLCRHIEAALERQGAKRHFIYTVLDMVHSYRAHMAAALAGFVIAVLVAVITGIPGRGDGNSSRFYFNEAVLQDVDHWLWPRPVVLAPGRSLDLTFNRDSEGFCHIKVSAPSGPVRLEIVHDDPETIVDPTHSLTVLKVHFLSLKNPRGCDRLIFVNRGGGILTISYRSPEDDTRKTLSPGGGARL